MNIKLSNPYFKRLSNQPDINVGEPCTLAGISLKILFFMLITAGGVYAYISGIVPEAYMTYAIIGAAATTIISILLNLLVPTGTPVIGSMFCLSEGFLVGWICSTYSKLYNGIIPIALGITFIIIIIMLFLYASKIIKVGQRFKAVISTMFLGSIVIGAIVFISSFFTNAISSVVYGNGWIGIAISAGALLIAALNLAVDFDNIAQGIQNQYSKKYEWSMAFGLVVTVILIFTRVLTLVAKIMSKTSED